jgi:hypothetical protein
MENERRPMRSALLAQSLSRSRQDLDDPALAAEPRAEFEARFTAELARLEKTRREVPGWEAERLVSALGAAGMQEWELALAFLASAARAPRVRRRDLPVALGTLRRRFHFVTRMGAASTSPR